MRGALAGRVPGPHGAHPAPPRLRQTCPGKQAVGTRPLARMGMGRRRAGALPSSVPGSGAHPGVCCQLPGTVVASPGWEMARVLLAATFLLLLPPMAGDPGVRGDAACGDVAVPCRAKRQSPGLKTQHGAVSTHTHAEGCGAELSLTLPSPHPPSPGARCSSPRAGRTPARGSLGGLGERGGRRDGAAFLQIKASGLSHV